MKNYLPIEETYAYDDAGRVTAKRVTVVMNGNEELVEVPLKPSILAPADQTDAAPPKNSEAAAAPTEPAAPETAPK